MIEWAARIALFSLASVAVVEGLRTPHPIAVRPAAEAVSTPVHASSRPVTVMANSPANAGGLAPATRHLAYIADPRVSSWVRRFSTTLKGDFAAALRRGRAYAPMISYKLEARGMPQELVYLPLIESNYQPSARSRVSAIGLWQFMAGTARELGLSVGRHADQRRDPAAETEAALAYLSQLHDRFNSWYLAAAAYNAGPGTVTRAMQRVLGRTTGSDSDFYRISGHLPAETRDYVPKLVAAARVGKDPARYGLAE